MTKIEEVAQVICEAYGYDWNKVRTAKREATINCIMHSTFLNAARAAISAMREPTEEMCEAGEQYAEYPSAENAALVFRAMIDRVLAEGGK